MNDLVLVKLSRQVDFIENEISPICTPYQGFPDIPEKENTLFRAFVSGWGATDFEDVNCTTNGYGPSPNSPCSNFVHKGKMRNKCTKKPSPSSQHSVCNKFYKWAKDNSVELWKDSFDKSYRIVYWQNSRRKFSRGRYKNVTCYNPSHGSFGWCGTCYEYGFDELKFGDHGFCSKEKRTQHIMFDYVRKKLGNSMHVNYPLQ